MEKYIKIALQEAKKAYKKNEIPVGAVIIKDNKVIAKAHNNRQRKHNLFGHAEINCILKAEKKIKDWRLDECEMVVTLMPCELCQMCIEKSRIDKIYYILEQDTKINDKLKNKLTKTNVRDINFKNYKNMVNNFFEKLRK